LKTRFLILHLPAVFNTDEAVISIKVAALMIVCSCNVLSDHEIRRAVCDATVDLPRSAKQVYDCLGRDVECGRCVRNIKAIIDQALGECAKACFAGCRHSQAAGGATDHQPFFLEAAE
jgi:bacterioferritin-associated ferredoxin